MSRLTRAIALAVTAVFCTAGTLVDPAAKVQKLAGDMKFLEGTVWIGRRLIFSDIAGNKLYQYTPGKGISVFRDDSAANNGNTVDRQGRLISCVQGRRAVERTEADGTITTLADRFEKKKFNSPNDVVVKSDDSIWFTDPPYGLPKGQKRELDHQWVYRIDPKTKAVTAVVTDMEMPNGLCFSPDEKLLYVGDSGKPHHIRVYDVAADGTTVANGRVFCTIDNGVPDGMRVDPTGRLWSTAGDGVDVFDTGGKLIRKISVPETPANLCFGGDDGKTLFIAARTSLYCLKVDPNQPPGLTPATGGGDTLDRDPAAHGSQSGLFSP
jgi:gluconolactonase